MLKYILLLCLISLNAWALDIGPSEEREAHVLDAKIASVVVADMLLNPRVRQSIQFYAPGAERFFLSGRNGISWPENLDVETDTWNQVLKLNNDSNIPILGIVISSYRKEGVKVDVTLIIYSAYNHSAIGGTVLYYQYDIESGEIDLGEIKS